MWQADNIYDRLGLPNDVEENGQLSNAVNDANSNALDGRRSDGGVGEKALYVSSRFPPGHGHCEGFFDFDDFHRMKRD